MAAAGLQDTAEQIADAEENLHYKHQGQTHPNEPSVRYAGRGGMPLPQDIPDGDEPRTEDLDYKDQGRDHPAERTVPGNDDRKPPARPRGRRDYDDDDMTA